MKLFRFCDWNGISYWFTIAAWCGVQLYALLSVGEVWAGVAITALWTVLSIYGWLSATNFERQHQ